MSTKSSDGINLYGSSVYYSTLAVWCVLCYVWYVSVDYWGGGEKRKKKNRTINSQTENTIRASDITKQNYGLTSFARTATFNCAE